MNEIFWNVLLGATFGLLLGTIVASAYCLIDSIRSKIKIFIIPLALATIGSIVLAVYFVLDLIEFIRG